MNNQVKLVKKLFFRKLQFQLTPFLISKEDYWGYINTSQMYYKARTVINFSTIFTFPLILLAFLYLHDQRITNIEIMIATIMGIIFAIPTIFAIKNNFWISLVLLSSIFSISSILFFLFTPIIKGNLFILIPFYLSLSHLIMLLRVKQIAKIQKISQ